MFDFQDLSYSWLLFFIPLYIILVFLTYRFYQQKIHALFSPSLLKDLIKGKSIKKIFFKKFLTLTAILLIIIALMSPIWGKIEVEQITNSTDLIILVDVSNSMLVEDIKPSRLEKVKLKIRKIIDLQKGNRVGITIFAGSSFVYTPLTTDYTSLHNFVKNITTKMVSKQGTDLTLGLETSLQAFMDNEAKKVLLVFTDGENHNQNYQNIINEFRQKQITVFMVGVGTENGEKIPLRNDENLVTEYLKDADGNFVISKIDYATLSYITRKTGGAYFPLTAQQDDISTVVSYINDLGKNQTGIDNKSVENNLYQIPVLIALMFLMIELFISIKKNTNKTKK